MKQYTKDDQTYKVGEVLKQGDRSIVPTHKWLIANGWVETPEPQTAQPYTPTYEDLVVEYIRERYSANDEFKVNAEREDAPEQWAEYRAYRLECKERARAKTEETINQ